MIDDERPEPRRARGEGRLFRSAREAFCPRYRATNSRWRDHRPQRRVRVVPTRGLYERSLRRPVIVAPISRSYTTDLFRIRPGTYSA